MDRPSTWAEREPELGGKTVSRFDSDLAEKLWDTSLDGGADEEVSNEVSGEWAGLMRDEKAVLYQSGSGFIFAEEFDTLDQATAAFEEYRKDLEG